MQKKKQNICEYKVFDYCDYTFDYCRTLQGESEHFRGQNH